MATITLHKFGMVPEEEDQQVFTFIFDRPDKLSDSKSVESTEVTYAGHRWSVVCMRKEERYVGIFLKWRYSDGQSSAAVSCKTKYTLTLVHRHDYMQNKLFYSTQKFTTAQSLLGKSKFVAFDTLLDLSSGYLDETGKRVVLELNLSRCATRFEKTVDTSPSARTRKNASGYYFDSCHFVLANHKWYLRAYTEKANSNGLPAVYLYLASKALGTSLEAQFNLNIGENSTEILTYNFGEGAKFDGFGKTLSEPLYNVRKLNSVTIGVEISSIVIYKIASVHMRPQSVYAPHLYRETGSYRSGGYKSQGSSLTAAEAFQDQEGNYWKMDLVRDAKKLTLSFDKGVHHFPNNKTKLLCWSGSVLSRDPERSRDIEMECEPLVGYFSNFIDDKGYLLPFPVDLSEMEESGNAYSDNGELLLRINIISLQTIPVGMRSIPRFDYQIKHLLKARQELQDNMRSLEDMREMSASRASLSMLDSSSGIHDDRLFSESSTSSGGNPKMQTCKSYDSLDALSTGDMISGDDDFGKNFFSDVLRQIAKAAIATPTNGHKPRDTWVATSRDNFHGTREDGVSTESGVTVSDESSLLMEARPSPVDVGRQREIINILAKFLQQRLPIRVSEVLESGSLGKGTSTRSRMDVDIIMFSPDLPRDGQTAWLPSMLQAIATFIRTASDNPDPFYPLPPCSDFSVTPTALQFTCGGMDVDVMLTHDWDCIESGGYVGLYDCSMKQTTPVGRQWCSIASSKLQKKFVADQPNEVKEIIKVVKHWRNCIQWKKVAHRPSSYLLSLLVIKAVEETRSFDMKRVIQKVGAYVLAPELSLAWSIYYIPDKYVVEWDPPSPSIRDPANPGVNVAESLSYWGQFRAEMILWLKSLAVQLNGLA